MKVLLHIAWAVIVVMCAGACSKKESPNSVKAQTQAMEAAIRSAQIDPTDTMSLQNELLKAEAMRSAFALDSDSVAMEQFDETFRETLLAKSPQMAKTLFAKTQ